MRDVVARDHNRAAVILWSVGNETPVKAAAHGIFEAACGLLPAARCHAIDYSGI
jgi:beta-galactosidase/beta-glucuronidase